MVHACQAITVEVQMQLWQNFDVTKGMFNVVSVLRLSCELLYVRPFLHQFESYIWPFKSIF